MKKTVLWIFAVLALAVAGTAIYRFCFRKSIPEAEQIVQVQSILQQNSCFVCHSFEPEKPFYASFPVIGKTMEKHMRHAVRFVELEEASEDLANAGEALLAKLEYCVLENTMPIIEYKMVHWGTSFNKAEKAVLTDWIRSRRAEILGSEEFAYMPVQPIPASLPTDPAKVDLGKRMFNDTRISLDNTISCASCHIIEDGGADHEDERTSEGIYGLHGGVNAPTVYNAVFNIQQFWNGRAADLKEQAAGPPVNPVEMGDQTWDDIVARLRKDAALVKEFERLFPGEGLTQSSVTEAIAEYEKTLITPDSRFDLYIKGDRNALNEDEVKGYKAFIENGCAACHAGKNFGGQSFEYMSVFGNYFAERDDDIQRNADDDGLMGFTGNPRDLERFKVPGLRNVALTAPYFHDGSEDDLDDAVENMFEYQLGVDPSDKLVDRITDFLKTLTGKHPDLKK